MKPLHAVLGSVLVLSSFAVQAEVSGNISLEGRYFNNEGAFPNQQKSGGVSISVQPEYKKTWNDGRAKLTFSPFYRWDEQDKERTHGDIRQLDFLSSKGDWEFQAGIGKVYWGVTESQHLIDVINQTDSVEGLDGEDKLGQPMVRISRLTDNGSLDLFVLPYFRERTFAGKKGRFRIPMVVDTKGATFESGSKEKHVDYAMRWAETFDEFDVGFHYFDGTSRDPDFNKNTPVVINGVQKIAPHYPQISQMGIDLQYTGESTIYKLETINRDFDDNSIKDYTAVAGGFEHTFPAFESGSEIGLLAEYHHDSRGEVKGVAFQNDFFVGARFALNDESSSDLLVGAVVDLDNNSKSFRVEASKRLGKGFKLNFEAQVFTDVDKSNPLDAFKQDDYLQLELQKFF